MTRHYVAEFPREMALILLRRLTTPKLAANLIKERAEREQVQLNSALLEKKARGVASAVDSALGYLKTDASNLNQALVARYYAMLQLTIAEQVADVKTAADLAAVQQYTTWGHGLAAFDVDNGRRFPQNFGVGFTSRGYFREYFKFVGVEVPQLGKKVDPMPSDHPDLARVDLLGDLLRTIPELQQVVYEHLGEPPRALRMGHAHSPASETSLDPRLLRLAGIPEGALGPEDPPQQRSFIEIYFAPGITLDYLRSLNLGPLQNLIEVPPDVWSERSHFQASFAHVTTLLGDWFKALNGYHSSFSGMMYIVPTATGLLDPYLINILTLYGLGIVARYRPDLWSEIAYGSLTDVRSLLEFYVTMFDMLIPVAALSRILGERVVISMPGTEQAPA